MLATKFPKYYRFTFCAEIQNCLREIQLLVSRSRKRYFKKTTLEDLDVQLDFLRELIMEAYEDVETTVAEKDLSIWISRVDEIGAMLGGWIKTETAKSSAVKMATPTKV